MFDSENLPIYYGRNGSLALFFSEEKAVVLDTEVNLVVQSGELESLSTSKKWEQTDETFSDSTLDLASGALFDLNLKVITADAGRMYTIPKGAQAEAKKALEWHKENHRGGTPVGLNTARILSRGGQIGLHKVRHIAKYFPRHEVDKKGKGWKPGEDGFPSNGRIAWALWGGDVAWRWAKAIVERENKALTADAYIELDSIIPLDTYDSDISAFEKSLVLDPSAAPEFIARVRLDGSGIDRLYKIDLSGEVYIWDGGGWDDLGNVENNVWSYDQALDDPYDLVEKAHITVDPDSAIIISAHLQENPFSNISINDIDETEAILAAEALMELDIPEIDSVVTAAGSAHEIAHQLPPQDLRQVRAVNAEKEMRGPHGKFAPGGSTKARLTQGPLGLGNPESTNWAESLPKPLDLSGILAVPRSPEDEPYAHLKGDLPAMTTGDLHGILSQWNSWVQGQRNAAGADGTATGPKSIISPTNAPDTSVAASAAEFDDATSETPFEPSEAPEDNDEQNEDEAHEDHERDFHPLISNWIKHKNRKKVKDLSKEWANPVIAAAPAPSDVEPVQQKSNDGVPAKISPDKGSKIHPDNSDVQPLYLAIVDADDPEAVSDLIAIVPETTASPSPMVYRRDHGVWIPDQKILNDLKSATPPPVVPLDSSELNSVLVQVDESSPPKKSNKPVATVAASIGADPNHILMVLWGQAPLAAAGGLDRNRGNAENLRHYWVYGPGAAKIRWGEGGDWSRCVRHLAKYLGVRAKGYCQLRHKEATGMYTATHAKLDRKLHGHEHSASEFIMEEVYTGNPGVPTSVHEKDMAKSLEEIMNKPDNIYDHHWEPHPEIQKQLKDLNKMSDDEYDSYMGADENTYFSSSHDDDDPCWDGYKQIGFKDKNGRHVPNCVKETAIIVATGGLDKNRGKAEKLRHYWTVGRGGVKIGWNTGGDWTRCVAHLGKYLGPRAKGYCALRHKEMTGMWTGDKMHRQIYGRKRNGENVFSTEILKSSETIIEEAILNAKRKDAIERIAIVAGGLKAPVLTEQGAKFTIPLVAPEETESGDGRKFSKGALSVRDLPLPLMWQMKTAQGHDGAVVVGRIDHMERIANGIGNAYGVFDNGAHGKEVQRLIKNGFLRGISVDLDKFEAQEMPSEAAEGDPESISQSKLSINKARVMGVTIVPKPAFQECKILIDTEPTNPQEDGMITDGIYVDDADASDAQALVACGIIAGAIPVVPPTEWFQNPKLNGPTPLTIDDNGRVFGHIAAWHVDHIGLAFGTKPPRSKSNYAYFHTGVVRTDSGKDIPVGQLTLAGGHASLEASASEAVKHYDDTASAIADVHAGEDQFGIWVAGSLRPSAAPEQIRALRASAPSGDWRPIRGALELVAVCQVNVPGFPIARARVASGAVMALVAAGASTLAKLKADPMAELNARIERLENLKFVNNGSTKNVPSKAELAAQIAELSARVREGELAYISRDEREDLAKKGEAMPDGSYPIRNVEDLRAAIHAYGRAKHPDLVKKHIIKRANELDFRHLIPESWKEASDSDYSEYSDKSDLRARLASFAAMAEFAKFTEDERKDLAKKGEALPDGSYPIRNEKDLHNAIHAFGRSKKEDRAKVKRHIVKRAKALGKESVLPEDWKKGMTASAEDLRARVAAATEALGKAPATDDKKVPQSLTEKSPTETVKKELYKDLPMSMQHFIDGVIKTAEKGLSPEQSEKILGHLKSFVAGKTLLTPPEVAEAIKNVMDATA